MDKCFCHFNGYEVKDAKARPFKSISEVKSRTNLVDRNIVKTIGYYEPNDGGGATYLIREKLESDVIDEGLIILLDNGLVAELIIENNEYNLIQLGFKTGSAYVSENNEKINSLLKDNITIVIPENKTLYLGVIELSNSFVKFTGGGSIYASIQCKGTQIKQQLNIENINLYGYEENSCVVMSYLIRSSIKNCKFYNCTKAIEYSSVDYAQQVSRISIDNNYFYNVEYALYGVRPENAAQPLIVADIHFTNNIVEYCKKSHIYVEGFDGGIISNNTFFFPSYMEKNGSKEYNIYIDYCNWTIISNNNLFEAGYESIKLQHSQAVRILGNNIAWCGQRKQSPGISIENYDISGSQKYNLCGITNNDIMFSTKQGIYLDNVGNITIGDNTIFGASSENSKAYYYGEESFSTGYQGIQATDTTHKISIVNNNVSQNGISNLGSHGITNNNTNENGVQTNIKVKTITGKIVAAEGYGTISLDVTPINIIQLYTATTNSTNASWTYDKDSNTIQLVKGDSTVEREFKFNIYYIDNKF